jgi:TRAP-type C4-dicarboxylate transport system permease small subunit
MSRHLTRIIHVITDLAVWIGGIFSVIMTLIVVYAVLARYLFKRPIGWSEEIAVYLMVWVVFLGAAYTLKENAHIGVDILISRLSASPKKGVLIFHYLMGIVLMSILFLKGVDMVAFTLQMNSHSIAIEFPLVIPHLAVPVGAAILVLQLIGKLISLAAERP